MSISLRRTAVLFFMVSPVALAAPAPALPGTYYLSGVPEVGSQLLLQANGTFQWALMYGAVDASAEGTWRLKNQILTLTAAQPDREPVFRAFAEGELNVRLRPRSGTWVAIVGIPRVAPAPGMAVRFEARSGKSAEAVSNANGDAVVNMPAGETWVRAGLRRQGSAAPWQWLPVPAARAQARIAGFAPDSTAWFRTPGFKSMQLKVEPKGLAIVSSEDGLSGTYVKP